MCSRHMCLKNKGAEEMKIIFNKQDKQDIAEWLKRDSAPEHATADLFIWYLNNSIKLNVEMASIQGEYEYWRDDLNYRGDF